MEIISYIILIIIILGIILLLFSCNTIKNTKIYRIFQKYSAIFSIILSNISNTIILGIPMEIYLFGSQIVFGLISEFLSYFFIKYYIIPVFFNEKITSTYKYLENRFGTKFKRIFTIQYVIPGFLFIPLYFYLSCLTINQIYDINIDFLIIILGFICMLCSVINIKYLISSDFFNAIILLLSIIFVIIFSSINSSKDFFINIFNSDRFKFIEFNLNPFYRISFFPMIISYFINGIETISLDEGVTMKINSFKTLKEKNKILFVVYLGIFIIKMLFVYLGFLIYDKYKFNDPVLSGQIVQYKNIVPYFIKDNIPNLLVNLFIYSVITTSFSSILIRVNSTSTFFYEEIFEKKIYKKIISINICFICILVTLILKNLTDIYQVVLSLCGLLTGNNLGIFIIGMYFKYINTDSVLLGNFTALCVNSLLIIGYQWYMFEEKFLYKTRFLSTILNGTIIEKTIDFSYNQITTDLFISNDISLNIFFISFIYYNIIGFTTTMFTSIISHYLMKYFNVL